MLRSRASVVCRCLLSPGSGRAPLSSSSGHRHFSTSGLRWRKGSGVAAGAGLTFSLGLLGFFEKKEKLSPEDELLLMIKRGILAVQQIEFAKAERHFHDAWKRAEEMDRDDVKTQIMAYQANLALQKGELDKASRLYQLVTQRLVYHQGVQVTDNSVVEISIKLAQIFAQKGKVQEALAGYQYCVDTQREKIKKGEKDEDTLMLAAWSLQSLAQAYMSSGTEMDTTNLGQISKASVLEKEALGYVTEAVGADSQQALAIASDLASILAMEGNVDAAIEQLEEVDKVAAEKYQYLQAAIRINAGTLYLQKGEYTEAEKLCTEARIIANMHHDTESVMRADECIRKSAQLSKPPTKPKEEMTKTKSEDKVTA